MADECAKREKESERSCVCECVQHRLTDTEIPKRDQMCQSVSWSLDDL